MKKLVAAIGQVSLLIFLLEGCSSNDEVGLIDCTASTLNLTLDGTSNSSSCITSDGTITVSATGGDSPYTFSIGTTSNETGNFTGLSAGTFEVKVVDANSCERVLTVQVLADGTTLSLATTSTSDTDCLADNGSIAATVTGGVGPYQFRINNEAFDTDSNFTNLKPGEYSVEVMDSEGCSFVNIVVVSKGESGVSFASQIEPIISTKCAITGCHNGDNGASRNWTIFNNVKNNASNIKSRTADRSMPQIGSLTQEQIDLIGCWVDDGAKSN